MFRFYTRINGRMVQDHATDDLNEVPGLVREYLDQRRYFYLRHDEKGFIMDSNSEIADVFGNATWVS